MQSCKRRTRSKRSKRSKRSTRRNYIGGVDNNNQAANGNQFNQVAATRNIRAAIIELNRIPQSVPPIEPTNESFFELLQAGIQALEHHDIIIDENHSDYHEHMNDILHDPNNFPDLNGTRGYQILTGAFDYVYGTLRRDME